MTGDPASASPWSRAGPATEAREPPVEARPPPAAPAQRTPGSAGLATEFCGRAGRLFWLALRTGGLTVVTLGIYRFWQKTRLRRWYWSAIRPGGLPLEYVGDPFEKLLGFLIAVCILAFYIGVVNLLLMFASFSLFQGNAFAYGLSLVGVAPLWFYAQYRARRYILARTRWRGLRFGLEPGAWGYAGRALWHWLVTLFSLGLLWPRMTYKLEKYKTDRTFFGDCRLEQGGHWRMLYPSARFILLAAGLAVAGIVAAALEAPVTASAFWLLAAAMLPFGLVYYRVDSLRRLTAEKRLGLVRLSLAASPMRVFLILVFGYLASALAVAVPAGMLGVVLLAIQSAETLDELGVGQLPLRGLDRWVLVAMGVGVYFTIFLIWSAVTHALVTMPLARHYARGLGIHGSAALEDVRQRPRDRHTEAEGFAEALDVGASL